MTGQPPSELLVDVTAAVIRRNGRYLVTQRAATQHLGGLWEFPGGKRQPEESLEASLIRELAEELGVHAEIGERLAVVPWAYPERRVVLHFFRCDIGAEAVSPREGQPLRWVTPAQLSRLPMPPADAAVVARLTAGSVAARERGQSPNLKTRKEQS